MFVEMDYYLGNYASMLNSKPFQIQLQKFLPVMIVALFLFLQFQIFEEMLTV